MSSSLLGIRSETLAALAAPFAVVAVALAGVGLPFVVASMSPDEPTVAVAQPPLDPIQVAHGRDLYAASCVACHAADAKGVASLGRDLTSGYAFANTDATVIAMIMKGRQPGEAGHTSAVAMPPKGGRDDLTRGDIADVVAYLRALQDPARLPGGMPAPASAETQAVEIASATPVTVAAEPSKAGATPANPPAAQIPSAGESGSVAASFNPEAAQRGKKVFNSCIACHGKNGTGIANLGADLVHSTFIAKKSDAELIAFIKKGRMPTDPETVMKLSMPAKGGNPALNDKQLADVVAYLRMLQSPQTASR